MRSETSIIDLKSDCDISITEEMICLTGDNGDE